MAIYFGKQKPKLHNISAKSPSPCIMQRVDKESWEGDFLNDYYYIHIQIDSIIIKKWVR